MENKKGIVVFGGAFNPPTNIHLALAEQIMYEFNYIEKVLFVPVGDLYPKNELISSNHRLNMLKLACKNNKNFEVSEIETSSKVLLNTIDSLILVKEHYSNHDIFFVTGTDNLKQMHTWQKSDILTKDFRFIVLEREDEIMEDIINENSLLLKNKENFIKLNEPIRTNCSSTIIRNRILNNKSFRYLIPEEVFEYIQKNNLYGRG